MPTLDTVDFYLGLRQKYKGMPPFLLIKDTSNLENAWIDEFSTLLTFYYKYFFPKGKTVTYWRIKDSSPPLNFSSKQNYYRKHKINRLLSKVKSIQKS